MGQGYFPGRCGSIGRGFLRVKRMARPEYTLQKSCVDFLIRCVPEPPAGPLWTACNPVPSKTKAVAGQSRALGLLRGWPDMTFAAQDGRAFHIEFKAGSGSLSPEQRSVHHWLSQLGHPVYVVTSLAEFEDALQEQGVEMKGRS
jgi:hypothetical protein